MATKQRIDMEMTLAHVLIPSLAKTGNHQHVLTVELICPRISVAQKSISKTIDISHGVTEADMLPWVRKICFKETVEGNFGLHVTVTERLSATQLRKALRFVAGKTLDIGADAVEDAIPIPVVDEIAKQPLMYASKQFLATTEAKIIVEGYLDMNASQIKGTPSLVTVPLVACHRKLIGGKDVSTADDADGSVSLSVVAL